MILLRHAAPAGKYLLRILKFRSATARGLTEWHVGILNTTFEQSRVQGIAGNCRRTGYPARYPASHSAAPDDFRIEDENVPVFDELAELAREPVLRPIIEDLATHARI